MSLSTNDLLALEENETARLKEQLAAMTQERNELREWNKAMVVKAASGGVLDGYREMGKQLAAMTKKADGFFDALQLAAKINAEGQAREQQLREALYDLWTKGEDCGGITMALALPQDDTALRQWGAKLLEESANESEAEGWMSITLSALRRKATKLREGKK